MPRAFRPAILIVIAALAACVPTRSDPRHGPRYRMTVLVADEEGLGAAHVDPNLVNPWGIAFFPGHPFWIADNNAGVITVYDGAGNSLLPAIPVPGPGGEGQGTPTGAVANPTTGFNGDPFLFA